MKENPDRIYKLVAVMIMIFVMVTYIFRPSMWRNAYQAALEGLRKANAPDTKPVGGHFFNAFPTETFESQRKFNRSTIMKAFGLKPLKLDRFKTFKIRWHQLYRGQAHANELEIDRTESRLLVDKDRLKNNPCTRLETGDYEEIDPDYDSDLDDYTQLG